MLEKVQPVQPVAAYIGGKRQLAKTIVPLIAQIPHTTYAEAFVGMGGIFLRRDAKPKSEVINDRSRDVSNLFRILQRHYQPFIEHLKYGLTGRAEFNRLLDSPPHTLTDLERAARFLYLQRTAFGGKVSGRNFGVSVGMPSRFSFTRLLPVLEDVYERLADVVIEDLDYKDFIARYDSAETLFYLDPPYFGNEGDYGRDLFDRAEFEKMAAILKGIKGRFILSLNNRPEVRKIFSGFHAVPVKTTYTIAAGNRAKEVGELLISNVKLKGLK
jgi:DNA adenine methylase